MKQREIKFRVWDVQQKRIISNAVVAGDIVIAEYDLLTEDTDFEPMYYSCENSKSKYPFVVMQYTGLKDKNGKEIYEGDIVSWGANITARIEYVAPEFIRHVNEYGLRNQTYPLKNHHLYEVIGNIYENKELLTNG